MSDKTETPRTDALVEKHYQGPANSSLTLAMEQLARQLERELAEKALEVEELRGLLALAAQELPHCSGPVHERIRVYRQEHSRQIEKVEAECAELREDAEKVRVAFFEFYGDWKKGDFSLSNLAQLDMESVASTFAAIDKARTE